MGTLHWSPERCQSVFDTFRDHWRAQPGQKALKSDWEATWRNWRRREGTFEKKVPLQKGEIRVRAGTPEEILQAKRRAEFLRLSRLNENYGKSDKEIWEMIS